MNITKIIFVTADGYRLDFFPCGDPRDPKPYWTDRDGPWDFYTEGKPFDVEGFTADRPIDSNGDPLEGEFKIVPG